MSVLFDKAPAPRAASSQVDRDKADQFVRKIYDWNPYASAYALAPEEGRTENPISREMTHVILSMLAERRWDPILATAERAEDALGILQTPDARRYLRASDIREVVQIVSSVQSAERWFDDWRRLFAHLKGPATKEELELISDQDGVLGWTVANVLKRLRLNTSQQHGLRAKTKSKSVSVRWRVVHTLGAFPNSANFGLLRKLLVRDPDESVRYGAIRSLVEMAARAPHELRDTIFGFLAENIRLLKAHRRILDEFARAVLVRVDFAPKGWTPSVAVVVGKLLDQSCEVSELDRWARLLSDLRKNYGGS